MGSHGCGRVETLQEPKVTRMPDPTRCQRSATDPWVNADPSDRARWETLNKKEATEEIHLRKQNKKFHSVVLGPCVEAMIAGIE